MCCIDVSVRSIYGPTIYAHHSLLRVREAKHYRSHQAGHDLARHVKDYRTLDRLFGLPYHNLPSIATKASFRELTGPAGTVCRISEMARKS